LNIDYCRLEILWTWVGAGIADVPAGRDNGNRKESDTVEAIRRCISSSGSQRQLAVCGLCGPEVAVRRFKFPALPKEEIEGAVLLEAGQVCPFKVKQGTVDYQLMQNKDDNIRGLLVAATSNLIEIKRQLATTASLKCVLMDVDSLALLNCFRSFRTDQSEQFRQDKSAAILNIGSTYTTLAIVADDGLPFTRDITYGGNDIIEQIASERGIGAGDVLQLLSGSENSAEPDAQLIDSLNQACRQLVVDIDETLRYFAAQQANEFVEKIYVCGGFALAKGFVGVLDKQLSAEAVLWNPFDKVRCEPGRHLENILASKGPALAVAAGLAMRSI